MRQIMLILWFAIAVNRVAPQQNRSTTPENLCPCSTANNGDEGVKSSSGIDSSSAVANFPPWASSPALHQLHTMMLHGMPCVCNLGLPKTPLRDDYKYTPGIGSHKLHTRALNWDEARKMCNEEGAHLAIVNSLAEAHVLMEIFNKSGPVKGAAYENVAYLGIHDLYKEGEWVTILGDSLARTGYTKWTDKWGGQPDNGGGRQHCGVLLKEGGLDDVACEVAFAFICELPALQPFH